MKNTTSEKIRVKFFAVFDNGLPAGEKYGTSATGGNRWIGRRVPLVNEYVTAWQRGEPVKFYEWDCAFYIEPHLFRVVKEVETVTVTEENL